MDEGRGAVKREILKPQLDFSFSMELCRLPVVGGLFLK